MLSDHAEEVRVLALCHEIGFGRVMQIAADAWAARDPIGALTSGPCAVFANAHLPECDARTMYKPCTCSSDRPAAAPEKASLANSNIVRSPESREGRSQ